jgi:hypothetical protein
MQTADWVVEFIDIQLCLFSNCDISDWLGIFDTRKLKITWATTESKGNVGCYLNLGIRFAWPAQLCYRRRNLPVGSLMLHRSKCMVASGPPASGLGLRLETSRRKTIYTYVTKLNDGWWMDNLVTLLRRCCKNSEVHLHQKGDVNGKL